MLEIDIKPTAHKQTCKLCGQELKRGKPKLCFYYNDRFGLKSECYHPKCVSKFIRKKLGLFR